MEKLYFRLRSGKFLWTWANGSGTYHPQNIRRYRPSPHHLVPAVIRPSHSRPCSPDDVTSSLSVKSQSGGCRNVVHGHGRHQLYRRVVGSLPLRTDVELIRREGPRSACGEVSTLECGRGARYLHPHHPRSFRWFLHSYTFPPVVIVREERAGR